jgi:CheY-like chemotaxis protein
MQAYVRMVQCFLFANSNERYVMDILLVDDNLLMQQVLHRFLGSLGYTVELAGRADEALEKASQSRAALILMDLYLPDRDGPEAIHAIRALPGYEMVPAIAMSGLDERDARQIMTSDFSAYIAKPVDLDALENMVRQYVAESNARSMGSRD